MAKLGLETTIVDRKVYDGTVARFREARLRLPTFAQLAAPDTIPSEVSAALAGVDRDAADGLNLFRVHWHNGASRHGGAAELVGVPEHVVLPPALTGVAAPIAVVLADRFPMIHAHKVLATYGCLAPRIVTGQFDPGRQKAVWPSTGNYCRGGVAISRIMGCRGVAVLPAGMSRERFAWLERWVSEPGDIVRTAGSESNVKEIYDRCAELERDPGNVVFNQFSEFGNHLAHYFCTGRAMDAVFGARREAAPGLQLRAFVSATGSAGTLAAGEYLKARHDSLVMAVEALECPTLLYNGFGEHNIQGIGDKHVPLIHNVMNTDVVTAVSDRATDALFVLFNSDAGREHLRGRGVPAAVIAELHRFGLSAICNVVAAIQLAKRRRLGTEDLLLTVATDGAELYASELEKILARDYADGFGAAAAGEVHDRYLLGADDEHLLELSRRDRERIFNLGYFTWVEQQGVSLEDFVARRDQAFWRGLHPLLATWDGMIEEFNRRAATG
ncbi:MAG: pyridoxal-5'-phosphate-dependent protein subunit beta [Acidobacteriota bacterium]|nr:pyridoxal-5'-phosphate-dependent protein subunit beta [Acidobacteriota bacterium]MDH3524082.1 pyridoxal-5'-phosphate-dependent protein subunit beta [Acidobacteriota bacterium]